MLNAVSRANLDEIHRKAKVVDGHIHHTVEVSSDKASGKSVKEEGEKVHEASEIHKGIDSEHKVHELSPVRVGEVVVK